MISSLVSSLMRNTKATGFPDSAVSNSVPYLVPLMLKKKKKTSKEQKHVYEKVATIHDSLIGIDLCSWALRSLQSVTYFIC